MAKWQGLTESEIEILAILWERGPSTVRDVFAALPESRRKGRTTTLKMMQLMHEKGLLLRKEEARAHVYSAGRQADTAKRGIVKDLVSKLFGGSPRALALQALGSDYSPDQLAEIERLLDEMERET